MTITPFGQQVSLAVPTPDAALLSITANSQSRSVDVTQHSNLALMCSGTFSTVNCAFEASLDATNDTDGVWFSVQAARTSTNTIETTTGNLSAAPAYAWELSVNGYKRFRVRSTAWTSGTQNWVIRPALFASEPIPAAQISGTQPVSGTVTANIGTGSLAAGTNAIGDVGLQVRANATGAASVAILNSPATPATQTIKGSAGRLLGFLLVNSNAATRYLKLFNATAPTLGTTAAVMDVPIPLSSNPVFISLPAGIGFSTAITCIITAGRGATNNQAITLDDVTGFAVFA